MLDHHHLLDELERRVEAARLAVSERRQECARLRARLNELEAMRLELLEENRELDEQNSELETHNRHLLEKLAAGESRGGSSPSSRRSQGLAALIGHRPRQNVSTPTADNTPTPAATSPRPATPASAPETVTQASSSSGPVPDDSSLATRHAAAEAPSVKGAADEDPPSPQALLAQWYQRYPATFFKGHTRPLKVGIHQDLATREPWPEKLVRRALAGYVNLPRYLKAVREGGERIDLEGQAAGTVDDQAADHARQKLERLQASRADPSRQGRLRGDTVRRDSSAKRSRDERRSPRETQGPGDKARDKPAVPKAHAGKRNDTPPREPATERVSQSPATLEDKLSALLAKHNRQG